MTIYGPLISGNWQAGADAKASIPATGGGAITTGAELYQVSDLADIERAVASGQQAAAELLASADQGRAAIAAFLERLAAALEANQDALVEMAHRETRLPIEPRLRSVELPRTTGQLRLAAAAARDQSWRVPTIDTRGNIRAMYEPLGGPVVVFGPNNFPFAFNAIGGGDFAAALASGHPVIAKANPGHLATTRLLAEAAQMALRESALSDSLVQLLYHLTPEDGLKLVAHPGVAAIAFTGSRDAGLQLKAAADRAGRPIYLEMSSVNPVVILPGALAERGEQIAAELAGSCLLGAGQFCTNPGLVILIQSPDSEAFIAATAAQFAAAASGELLSNHAPQAIAGSVQTLLDHGAQVVAGGAAVAGREAAFENTLLRVAGDQFLQHAAALQTEAFGPVSLVVLARDEEQLVDITRALEGGLTASVYSERSGADDALYARIAPALRLRAGRLLNDKMPTGVAVSLAMVHGGPYPATGHPGFTAVGLPAAMRRFAALRCYDNVRPSRLPPELRDPNPTGQLWRLIDGEWTQRHVAANVESGT